LRHDFSRCGHVFGGGMNGPIARANNVARNPVISAAKSEWGGFSTRIGAVNVDRSSFWRTAMSERTARWVALRPGYA
jgi:hypothetical protein